MSKSSPAEIRLRGVRHNNLKNFDLDLPLNQLIVITGLSGSGKSSLAFDTLFAEGQRRYIETFSPYARQFFDRMDKPQVDRIEGIPPAIAIEQRNSVRTTRSTVGTMTEIHDYMKLLWPHVAHLHCRQCGRRVGKDSPQQIWEKVTGALAESSPADPVLITFDVALSDKMPVADSLALISKQGYQRLLVEGGIVRIDEWTPSGPHLCLSVVQDRVRLSPAERARFVEACEQAYHFGKGRLTVHLQPDSRAAKSAFRFSNRLHCAPCDIDYREPSPALFSFNHPIGACPTCKGFGRVISIDYNLAIPDTSRTLAEGVVKPWFSGQGAESQSDLLKACRHFGIPTDVPFEQLPKKWRDFVIEGEPGYGTDEEHEWPRAWYGVKGYFRWLETKAYKMHVRVLLSRYRAYTPCPDCRGARFQPESLLYRLDAVECPGLQVRRNGESVSLDLAAFYSLPLRDARMLIDQLAAGRNLNPADPIGLVLAEVRSRLGFLNDVGLGYLTLDRPTRSLSGGETERVNLTTCLGTRLVNTLFVLDEPSVGLHPRDTDRLVRILQQLRDAGNTVVVVEHESSVMRAADRIIDLGPGHGAGGGSIVFQGSYSEILKSSRSITGEYLSGRRKIEVPPRRPVSTSAAPLYLNDSATPLSPAHPKQNFLRLTNVARHNLREVNVEIPLTRFVCVTGVSGSGKTTLVRDVLLPALEATLRSRAAIKKHALRASDRFDSAASTELSPDETDETESFGVPPIQIAGAEHLERVVLVDQSILGKTPRSNPAVYVGAFDDIRDVFAQGESARQRGLNASAFSFNSAQGQCERCRGAGFEKIEMQFLSDVFIRCGECNGRRYRPHILDIRCEGGVTSGGARRVAWSVADVLDATVDEAIEFLTSISDSRPAQRAAASLRLLQETGLGYLKLGQPINTLSGGESQRLKLVRHLAEAILAASDNGSNAAGAASEPILFLFDEPTTGLHFDDVRVLLKVFHRLVDAGHSLVVIEHNLDVIRSADWVIDLGPGAGDEGGRIVALGTPEDIMACAESHTGRFLRDADRPEPVSSSVSNRVRTRRKQRQVRSRKLQLFR